MSDIELRQMAADALEFDPSIDAANIGVAADAGIVTLTGHVPTYGQKLRAEEAVMALRGVKAVALEIEVRPGGAHSTADDEIAHRILNVLRWNTTIPPESVKASVQKGWVTLSGTVEWNYQREAASRVVGEISGVKGVSNTIHIAPKATPSDLRKRIETALKRQAEIDMLGISVELSEGTVTLKGQVHSLLERRLAERAVWAAPGVRDVRDQLSVS